jgi:hypothetical protein
MSTDNRPTRPDLEAIEARAKESRFIAITPKDTAILVAYTRSLEAERDAWQKWQDSPTEHDDAISAAFPTRSGSHVQYAQAMEMVGTRHSKGALVALVNWLLVERDALKDAVNHWADCAVHHIEGDTCDMGCHPSATDVVLAGNARIVSLETERDSARAVLEELHEDIAEHLPACALSGDDDDVASPGETVEYAGAEIGRLSAQLDAANLKAAALAAQLRESDAGAAKLRKALEYALAPQAVREGMTDALFRTLSAALATGAGRTLAERVVKLEEATALSLVALEATSIATFPYTDKGNSALVKVQDACRALAALRSEPAGGGE